MAIEQVFCFVPALGQCSCGMPYQRAEGCIECWVVSGVRIHCRDNTERLLRVSFDPAPEQGCGYER
jgi:hypothetical protein